MKKFILLVSLALMSISASAAQWAVVGAYTDPAWNFDASTQFTGSGDNLTCTIENFTGGFKIVDISNNNWDVQYGTSTPIQINQEFTLDGKNGGDDPSNMELAFPVGSLTNATISWNPTSHTMKISATESEVVKSYPTLYATGSFCNWNGPGDGNSVQAKEENGVYTVTIDLGTASNTEFKLAGPNWTNEVAGGFNISADAATIVTQGGNNLTTNLTGSQTLTFNMNTMMMTFGEPSLASERKWAVVGSYSEWAFEKSTVLTLNDDGMFSCTIDNLTNDFKIVDITNNNWDVQYGSSTPLEINTPIVLVAKNGGDDPANMSFAGMIQSVKNATINWYPITATMEIIADDEDLEIAYPVLYLTGSFCSWNAPGEGSSILCKEDKGIYTATVDFGEGTDKKEFKLAGPGWSNEIAGGVEVNDKDVTDVTKGGENLFTYLSGSQTLMFDYATMKMTFNPDIITGVETLGEVENDSEPVYYNLQGVRVANPGKGIYIVRKGTKVSKEIR